VTADSNGVAGTIQTVGLTGTGVGGNPPVTACAPGRNIPAGQWTAFSLPCVVSAPGTVESIFASLIAANYGSNWSVLEHDEATNAYNKLNLNSTLEQGKGYWLKSTEAARFEVTGAPTPVTHPVGCASGAGCYEISLTPPATSKGLYSLAGNPFPANVDWSAIRVVANGGNAVTPSQAEASGDLSKSFWIWNGAGYNAFDDTTPGMSGQLQAGDGMWVKVLDPTLASIKLLIPAPDTGAGATSTSILSGARPLKATEWYVRLTVESVGENLKDSGTVLGHLTDSKAVFDSHDLPELPPSFTPYLSATFPRPGWGLNAGDYESDFHKVKSGPDSCRFVVRSENTARQMRLSWLVTGKAPANMPLKDNKTAKLTAVKVGSYTFKMGGKERAFTWNVN